MSAKVFAFQRNGISPDLVRAMDVLEDEMLAAVEKGCEAGIPLAFVLGMLKIIEIDVLQSSAAGQEEE